MNTTTQLICAHDAEDELLINNERKCETLKRCRNPCATRVTRGQSTKIVTRGCSLLYQSICDATETGGTPPVTTTNETTPPPWRRQAALV